jgi:mono/diheme cytochrome c family protein
MKTLLTLSLAFAVACSGGSDSGAAAGGAEQRPDRYEIGKPADAAHLALLDIDVDPTGVGLPEGAGTHAQGAVVYVQKCAGCHGPKGEGMAAAPPLPAMPKLVGRDPREGFPFGSDPKLVKTVGNYWPYATTLYDYIHRAMPIASPGSLQPNEVYAVVAWLLAENEVIPKDAEMNAKTLPTVKMPAHDKFVVDNRTGGAVVR